MLQNRRPLRSIALVAVLAATLAGCGGGSSGTGGGGDGGSANPWIGNWSAVSENGAPASGQLSLQAGSFSQTFQLPGVGVCTWTGSISGVTATTLTIATNTAEGPPPCSQAIGRSATPSWSVSPDNNTLTLDYRGSIAFGTLQVWQRI